VRLTAEWLGRTVDIRIDRPLGSKHPQHPNIVYGVNYGELPGTMAADGSPIDAYVLGPKEAIKACSGVVIAIVHRHDDSEDKLVVSTEGTWTAAAIEAAIAFQECFFDSSIEMAPGS